MNSARGAHLIRFGSQPLSDRLLPVWSKQITRVRPRFSRGECFFKAFSSFFEELKRCCLGFESMALMASQAQCAALSLHRSAVVPSSRRAASPPSAFFAPEVRASCSSSSVRALTAAASRRGRAPQRKPAAVVVCGLFGLGAPELVVIAGVAALLFGPKQLPQLGKKLGQSVKSFQQAAKEFESEVNGESDEVSEEKETITPTPVATPSKTENTTS